MNVEIKFDDKVLKGVLFIPEKAKSLVIFSHGSGSGRLSPRNQFVAGQLNKEGIATLLMDLLTKEEEIVDDVTAELRFDILFLAERLIAVINWTKKHLKTKSLKIGLFGASTGVAAALIAAARMSKDIFAVVSRGGRPDLAETVLLQVRSPTLLIVGGDDVDVLELNKKAFAKLTCEKKLEIVEGATHLFEEPGKLEEVARLAMRWFKMHS